MLAKTRRLFESWLSDVTLPIVSLLGGHRTGRRLRECIPDVQIEDLWLPCFCVSSNLTRADIETMGRVVDEISALRGGTEEPVAGSTPWRHRLMSLGHDPLKDPDA